MITQESKTTPAIVTITSAIAGVAAAADNRSIETLIAKIKDKDDAVRGPAWQNAGLAGAPAVKPLAEVMNDPDFEIARAAKRALWQIVRFAGRPGSEPEAKAVVAQLLPLLSSGNVSIRREALWMLSEIGDSEAVAPIAALLSDMEAREDARCALERIPGSEATAALRKGLDAAPTDFKSSIAHSLRVRGEKIYPSQKLVPTKQTSVKPIAQK